MDKNFDGSGVCDMPRSFRVRELIDALERASEISRDGDEAIMRLYIDGRETPLRGISVGVGIVLYNSTSVQRWEGRQS